MFQVAPANRAIIPHYHLNWESRWCHNRSVFLRCRRDHGFPGVCVCQSPGSECPLLGSATCLGYDRLWVASRKRIGERIGVHLVGLATKVDDEPVFVLNCS
jgi:hypothetical protein